ncbi:ABC transporter permease [Gracilibacillus massiliensis]|uniref:ABC transporter permease n=1 Tax=Gracilibacillus massiliensis TaxID=1564956 RepID=UPI00071E391F|nr:ABC transporter permease [Gracilibacillus massiliensis]
MAKSNNQSKKFNLGTTMIWLFGSLVYLFMTIPVLIIVLSSFSPNAYPEFPPTSFSIRWYVELFTSSAWLETLWTSVLLVLIVTPITVTLGTAAAVAIRRLNFPGKQALQAMMMSPLMIPHVVLGIAFLYQGTAMGWFGTLTALIIAHAVIVFPFVIRSVGVSMSNLDPILEQASMSLGAGPIRTFFKVTVPNIKPGIMAGAVFAGVTSFGEVSVSVFVSSPQFVTVPVRIFNYVEQTFDPVINAVSVVFILISVIALVIIEKTIGLTKAF